MKNYRQYKVLSWAFSYLKEYDREEPVAELLLQHHLQVDRTRFYARMQEEVPVEVWEMFKTDIEKHALTGIPVQHLLGYEAFYGREFSVNEHVLIPRMETEELILYVVNDMKKRQDLVEPTLVDVGTGSGIIAVTLAKELYGVKIYATDISRDALQMAKKNADFHQANITFYQGNFLQPIIDEDLNPEIIVANPPYISAAEATTLTDTVRNFDPALALFAEEEGLAAYKEILQQVKSHIPNTKYIYFEIGYNQNVSITKLTQSIFPHSTVTCIQDINGNDRIIAISL